MAPARARAQTGRIAARGRRPAVGGRVHLHRLQAVPVPQAMMLRERIEAGLSVIEEGLTEPKIITLRIGGEGGIRTHEELAPLTVFKFAPRRLTASFTQAWVKCGARVVPFIRMPRCPGCCVADCVADASAHPGRAWRCGHPIQARQPYGVGGSETSRGGWDFEATVPRSPRRFLAARLRSGDAGASDIAAQS